MRHRPTKYPKKRVPLHARPRFGKVIVSVDVWRDQGKKRQPPELLAPVYGWFTEGFDTRDLKEARVLLQELAR
jgi:hypothetical protein